MPLLERIGLEAVFLTKDFAHSITIYKHLLDRTERATTKTAENLTAAWGDSTAGLEDMFSQLDVMAGQADDVAAGLAALGTEATAMSAGMIAAGVATAGVVIALAAVAAVGVAIWNKIDDAAMEFVATNEEVVKAQERVNAEWEKAGQYLGASLIPLKRELLAIELELAEMITKVTKVASLGIAIVYASIASQIEQLKMLPETITGLITGEIPSFEAAWEQLAAAGQEKFNEVMQTYADAVSDVGKQEEKAVEQAEDNWDKIVDAVQSALDRIEDMQIAHNRRLADLADDHRIRQERAWAKYEKSVAKEIIRGQKAIAKIEEKYSKRRAKIIADYEKRIAKAEAKVNEAHIKAREDYERRERHTRERFRLDVLQSERRYQFERNRLVAEGDTLAIEQLDALHKLEQQEAEENERLRRRQAQETQDAMVKAMEAAGRAQAEALVEALAEQLAELEEQSHREVEERRLTNQERLDEMAQGYADQQRLADEDYQRSVEKANLNYQRQQEDLGRNLARQEELQELGGEEVERILQRYYGEDGIADRIMRSYYERRAAEIVAYAALATQMGEYAPLFPGGIPMPGQQVGMQMGGILEGPAMAYIEPGVTEAFIPLTGPGAGGSAFTHEFMNALNITGLEGASPADVSRIAKELATSLTSKIRSRRRN